MPVRLAWQKRKTPESYIKAALPLLAPAVFGIQLIETKFVRQ